MSAPFLLFFLFSALPLLVLLIGILHLLGIEHFLVLLLLQDFVFVFVLLLLKCCHQILLVHLSLLASSHSNFIILLLFLFYISIEQVIDFLWFGLLSWNDHFRISLHVFLLQLTSLLLVFLSQKILDWLCFLQIYCSLLVRSYQDFGEFFSFLSLIHLLSHSRLNREQELLLLSIFLHIISHILTLQIFIKL